MSEPSFHITRVTSLVLISFSYTSDTLWLDKNGLQRLLGEHDDQQMKFSESRLTVIDLYRELC